MDVGEGGSWGVLSVARVWNAGSKVSKRLVAWPNVSSAAAKRMIPVSKSLELGRR